MFSTHKLVPAPQGFLAALLFVMMLTGCGGGGSGGGNSPSAPSLVMLNGDVSPGVTSAPVIGPVDPQMTVSLGLTLPLRGITPPQSGQPLTPEQFTAMYGPTQADYDHLQAFATASGLQVTGTSPSRTILDVAGTAQAVEAAFHLHLLRLRRLDGSEAYGPDVEPSVPADVAALGLGIIGLDDLSVPSPAGGGAVPVDKQANAVHPKT